MKRILIPVGIVLGALVALLLLVFLFGDISFPVNPPSLDRTYIRDTRPAPLEMGSFDILGHVVSRQQAAALLQTRAGQEMLSREHGAIEITEDLIKLGRQAFYLETFGNEVALTDLVGVMDGPLNPGNVARAIIGLGGRHTTNLQLPVDKDITVGGRTFRAGTVLNTGLDVPAGALLPLGMRARLVRGELKMGITCAMCHVTLDPENGRLIEGASNVDINTGLLLAMASNSAAFFRRTDVDLRALPVGKHSFINTQGQREFLPDAQALEDAVDAAFLTWPPGTFDATDDQIVNPTFIASSYTFGQWPYGWNGFGSLGWFKGLSTLNNNVHAVSADPTTAAGAAPVVLGMDEETYLALLFQNASARRFRLPDGIRPTRYFKAVQPTPGAPALIHVVVMPYYPNGSAFLPNGLLANSPGMPVGEQVNAMSAYQNTLAPPPTRLAGDVQALRRGLAVFQAAKCDSCHSGRFFSNNSVVPLSQIGTEPTRARGQAKQKELFVAPLVYPPSITAPPVYGPGLFHFPRTAV